MPPRLSLLIRPRANRKSFLAAVTLATCSCRGNLFSPADGSTPPTVACLRPGLCIRILKGKLAETRFSRTKDAEAIALAAIRETFEEAGLVVGTKDATGGNVPPGPWSKFVQTGFYPDPSRLRFVARAITPPGFARRFDARFFCVEDDAIVHRLGNIAHPDAELVELAWLPITAARMADLPIITRLVLDELQTALRAGREGSQTLPVPFFITRDGEFMRELIE